MFFVRAKYGMSCEMRLFLCSGIKTLKYKTIFYIDKGICHLVICASSCLSV